MIQYWIQVPVENARETTQRFIEDNLSAYDGYELTYTIETEAVVINLAGTFTYDFNTIYFGEVRVATPENSLILSVTDNITTVATLSSSSWPIQAGKYPYIIFNEVTSQPAKNAYFVGYKFAIAAIEPDVSYLLTEAGEIFETEDGIDLIQL